MNNLVKKLTDLPSERRFYALQTLPAHLAEAGQQNRLKQILTTFDFLQSKVNIFSPNLLIQDYNNCNDYALSLIQDTVRLCAHVVAEDSTQLAGQLLSRMLDFDSPEISDLLKGAKRYKDSPWLQPFTRCLSQPGGPLKRTLSGHNHYINHVSVTNDGQYIVSIAQDGVVKVWELANGMEINSFFAGFSHELILSPNGQSAITVSTDGVMTQWDMKQGTKISPLDVYGYPLMISPNGRYLVIAWQSTLRFWDLVECRSYGDILKHRSFSVDYNSYYKLIAVTPDITHAISADDDHSLKVWNLMSGREKCTLCGGHDSKVTRVVISPDGRRAVSTSGKPYAKNSTLVVWDLEKGTILHTLKRNSPQVNALAITPDGNRIVAGIWGGAIEVWNIESGFNLCTLKGHDGWIWSVAITPDSKYAVTGSFDRTLKVWNLENLKTPRKSYGHSGQVWSIVLSQKYQCAISASNDQSIKTWSLNSGSECLTLNAHKGGVRCIQLTPDEDKLVSGGADGNLILWDLSTGSLRKLMHGHEKMITSMVLLPDGRHAVSCSIDGSLILWDLEEGISVKRLYVQSGIVAIDSDFQLAVSASTDGTLWVWDIQRGIVLHKLRGHTDQVTKVIISPDNQLAISASRDSTLRVWELRSGKAVNKLESEIGAVTSIGFIANGDHLLLGVSKHYGPIGELPVGAKYHAIQLLDLKNWKILSTFRGHTQTVTQAIFVEKKNIIISSSEDKTILVWDLKRAIPISKFTCEEGLSTCVATSDGRTIVAAGSSGQLYFLRLQGIKSLESN